MNLIIDIGNTRTKVAVFDEDGIVTQQVYNELMICDVEQMLALYPKTNKGILSSTIQRDDELINYLSQTLAFFIELNSFIKVPFKNLYKTPDTLGTDRIALVAGASMLYPGKNILIIGAGSAITYDFINAQNEYLGGNISPGIEMRFKALHTFTGKLPLFSKDKDISGLGKDTKTAIVAGVQNGVVSEIEGYINLLSKSYNILTVILTGGDADFLADKLKYSIFAIPNLTLIGLNRILNTHAN
jgi:type III pantothenate kinase